MYVEIWYLTCLRILVLDEYEKIVLKWQKIGIANGRAY